MWNLLQCYTRQKINLSSMRGAWRCNLDSNPSGVGNFSLCLLWMWGHFQEFMWWCEHLRFESFEIWVILERERRVSALRNSSRNAFNNCIVVSSFGPIIRIAQIYLVCSDTPCILGFLECKDNTERYWEVQLQNEYYKEDR